MTFAEYLLYNNYSADLNNLTALNTVVAVNNNQSYNTEINTVTN